MRRGTAHSHVNNTLTYIVCMDAHQLEHSVKNDKESEMIMFSLLSRCTSEVLNDHNRYHI